MANRPKVYIVGAGPGDPGLITLKAIECIKKADVVLYDRLISKDILRYRKKGSILKYVGKSKGGKFSQDDINSLLLRYGRAKKRIVRLKGGDPFIFGRGKEEALFLMDHGIDYEVIPGVSSFYAAAEVFGIPLTRRGIASGFIVVTGSEDPEKETEAVDWKHLAKFNGTIVILMGKSNLDDIVKKLRKFGMDPEIPCAVIYKGTTSQQKIAASTLRDIAKASSHLPAPSIVIIGDVVNMRDRHLIHSRPQNRAIYGANGAWPLSISLRETTGLSPRSFIKPLSGKRYLATATNGLNKDILKNFKELGADIDCVSMVKVLPNKDYSVLDRVISRVKRFDWLVFTSRHGALYFLERFYKLGGRETELKNRIACVGSGTANEFIKRDIRIELMPKKFTTKDLAIELSKRALKGKDIALLRTTVEKDYMKDILSTTGANIVDCIVYNIKELKSSKRLDKALLKRPDSILFLSPRSVDCFFNIISGRIKEDLKKGSPFVSIGPVTTNALKAKGINRIIEPEKHTVKGLAEVCVAMADRGIV